jgi:hypothetical protein
MQTNKYSKNTFLVKTVLSAEQEETPPPEQRKRNDWDRHNNQNGP